jgi:phosphate transport system substrate-binding protein
MNLRLILLCGWLGIISCEPGKKLDTPTKGKISMVIDENYFPIIDTALDVFHSVYVQAQINPVYLPEGDAFKLFIEDSIEVIISARNLNEEELKFIEDKKIVPKIYEIGRDALAIIVHPSFGETKFSLDQLKQIVTGEISDWSALEKPAGSIQLVFDHKNSSGVRYAIDSLANGGPLTENAFASKNITEVINHVAENPGSIGIIGINWVSDMHDPESQKFVNSVEVASVSRTIDSEAFKPFQAYIAKKDYPLSRSMYIISRQGRNGLGIGFASFMASDRGQKIVLTSGLVPATMPIRLVEVKDQMPQ